MTLFTFFSRLTRMINNISVDEKLSKEAIRSIIIHSIFQFGASMSGVFLNLYLWRLTESLFVNGLYTMIVYITAPLAFAFAGKFAKSRDRLFAYRSGIGLTALFYLFVIIAGEAVVDYYAVFAVMSGIASAFYWVGYLTMIYDYSTDRNRIRYLGFNSIFFNFAGLMGPIIAGVIISMNEGLRGYTIVFTMAFVMFLFTTMGSLRLASQGSHHKSYYLGLIPLLIRKNKSFRHGLYGWFILGAYQGLLILLPNILLFHVLQKENLVGYTSGALLVLTMIAGFYMTRFGKSELARLYILIASFGFVVGAFVMLWFGLHLWTVIFFTVTFYGCIPLLVNSFTAYYYYLIGTLPLKGNLRVETVVVREMFLNTGRFVGILGLITVSSDLYSPWIGAVLFVTAMLQFNFLWIIKPRQPHNTP